MTTEEMIKALNGAINDIGAVVEDLKDARDGDMDLGDVNRAYLSQAVRVTQEVDRVLLGAA